MYTPPAFVENDAEEIKAIIRRARLAHLVTATATGPVITPLPLLLDETEGGSGVLYGHVAKANPHWRAEALGESAAIFMGPDAYVTPSWYATKRDTGKVVPTWNYVTVHAHGPVEFFQDYDRLLEVVTRLTGLHEGSRTEPWQVTDAPADYISAQLRGIVGLRMQVTRFEAKKKMSQNRSEADSRGVAQGLAQSDLPAERDAARLVPLTLSSARRPMRSCAARAFDVTISTAKPADPACRNRLFAKQTSQSDCGASLCAMARRRTDSAELNLDPRHRSRRREQIE